MSDNLVHRAMEDLKSVYKIPSGINITAVKKEVSYPELPELGDAGNLVLNSDCESTNSLTADEPNESVGDPAEIQECLTLNQALQRQFVTILNKIQSSLDRNIAKQAKLQDEVEEIPDKGTKLTSQKSAKLFCSPYFRDVRGLVPPENEETIIKTKNRDVNAYVQPPKPWSDEEKSRLLNGVLASALDFALRKYKAKRDFLKSKLSSPELSDEEKKEVKRNIKQIENRIAEENKREPADLLKEAEGNIDWLKVSATDLEGARSEDDCEIMWNNYLSIFVNKKPFTKDEDNRLVKLAISHSLQNWDGVAQLLGTQRSAIQCIERYQTELNNDLVKSYWAPEEDEKLLEIIENVRVGSFIPWNQVLLYMEGRTRHQLITRYERTLKGSLDKGPWSKYEDAMLLACVAKFGCKWVRMQDFFPRRTSYHCRERYVNHLDATIKIGSWTREEDVKLGESILKHGYKWSKIAAEMPGRTDNMLLTRFKRLVLFLGNINPNLTEKDKQDPGFLLKYLPKEGTLTSHNCKLQNDKLRATQSDALEALKTAVDNISATFPKDVAFAKNDFSSFNIQLLERLHKELKRMENTEAEEPSVEKIITPARYSLPRYVKTKQKVLDLDGLSDYENYPYESQSEVDEDSELPEIDLEDYDVLWLHKVLETKLQEECASYDVLPLIYTFKAPSSRTQTCLERDFYTEYLRKEMGLPYSVNATEKQLEKMNLILHDVVRHFIQPKVSDNEVMVLPPNRTSLLGMDMMLACKPRLRRTAHFVDHSTSYIRYLTGSKIQPLCLKCSSEKIKREKSSSEAYQKSVKEMKSKLLVVDGSFDDAAKLETCHLPQEKDFCVCSALVQSKDQVDLLMKRFVSLFFLPHFLSTVPIPREQDEILVPELYSPPVQQSRKKTNQKPHKKQKVIKRKEEKQRDEPVKKKRRGSPGPPMRKSQRLSGKNRASFKETSENEENNE